MSNPLETATRSGPTVLEPGSEVTLPVLPVKNTVLFPFLFLPLSVGRPKSVAAVEAALGSEDKTICVVAQRLPNVESPKREDLYSVGTRAVIKKLSRSEGTIEILVQGLDRVRVLEIVREEPHIEARLQVLPLPAGEGPEIEALLREVQEAARRIVELSQPELQPHLMQIIQQSPSVAWLAYMLASMLSLDLEKEQSLLECDSLKELLEKLHNYLVQEIQILEIRQKVKERAMSEMSKEQREYMLRQQLKAIREELGEEAPELEDLKKKLEEADLPDYVRKEAERELRRLEHIPSVSPEYQVVRTYLELVLELPWKVSTQDNLDIENARRVLDEDHYDLDDIKNRILEHLAVMRLNPEAHGPILCFVGPPGVGKTSLGKSIARALGRKFERMSLGGLHDEAELRGHRRTYVGAMPGRIIQAIRRAGVNNPVLMLDEVDKIGRDFRGDPAAALLEILDPAQNHEFRDNYLDLPFDLSRVFFICTANTLDTIPRPLLDRMEVLRLAGYTPEEKLMIARRYLVPRQLREVGLSENMIEFTDDAIRYIISRYTREAGVRELERMIGRVIRRVAVKVAEGRQEKTVVTPDNLKEFLGPERFPADLPRPTLPPGVVAGLAWTEWGGEVLYVEAVKLPEGKGVRVTGSLGPVMKESAHAAFSYVWAHASDFGLNPRDFRTNGVHVHVPSGAVPKDGPSAGVAIATAIASAFSGVPADPRTAMTGEITLSGLVLPVGGIKEKVLAAHRTGMKCVILPEENRKDLEEVPADVREALEFVFVQEVRQVIERALPGLAAAIGAGAG